MSVVALLYDLLLPERSASTLTTLRTDGTSVLAVPVTRALAPLLLAQHLRPLIERALSSLWTDKSDSEAPALALANELVDTLHRAAPDAVSPGDRATASRLLALFHARTLGGGAPARPGIPLGETALLVNAPEELRVGSELALELESADEVDLLCSFVKWSGYVRLKDSLTRYLRDQRRPLRVITTAYMGATERRALDELCKLGAQVRISYDTRRTRLHAKAWLFRRNSGFSTAYIGSSNLSAAARSSLGSSRPHLEAELRRIGDVDLATFLREAGLSVAALYRGGRTFTGLRRAVGLERSRAPEGEAELGEALERLVHLDDPGRIGRIRTLLDGGKLPGERGVRERLMLGGAVIGRNGPGELDAWLAALRKAKVLRGELDQLFAVLAEDAPYLARPMPVLPLVPLQQHCRYNLVEILAAFGALAKGGKSLQQPLTGVHFDRETKADLLFVTLEKGEKQYSATTRYRDYPVSPTEFHWESQNTATPESTAGRRHLRHEELGVTPLLFVRTRKKAPGGATVPYTFLGPVKYLRHTGAKPMQLVWRLGTAMPAELFQELKLAAG